MRNWKSGKSVSLLALREAPEGSYISADAFVFMTPSSSHALQIREGLIERAYLQKYYQKQFRGILPVCGNTFPRLECVARTPGVYTNYHRRFLNVP